jgi:hypothetical protein
VAVSFIGEGNQSTRRKSPIGLWFSPGTPACSTTKTGRHDIAAILVKVTLNTINQINSIFPFKMK